MKHKYVLGVAGSIRSNFKRIDRLEDAVRQSNTIDDLIEWIGSGAYRYSNSDISLAISMFEVKNAGYDFKMISISNIFKHFEELGADTKNGLGHLEDIDNIDFLALDEDALNEFYDLIKKASGIILSSPVYFGDRSSVANKFLQLTNKHKMLKNKVFGMIATGAKRNGGQETTCIYGLYDALMQEAICVGNGPKTSQYGGTVVAGNAGTAIKDAWGLERCRELGTRVGQLSEIVDQGKVHKRKKKLNIQILVAIDTIDKRYQKIVEKYFEPYTKNHNISFLNLIDYDIFRCVGCDVCPAYLSESESTEESAYACSVRKKNDMFRTIHKEIQNKDCLIIVGVNTKENVNYRYQAFTERTRFIRRDNFQLTNTAIIGFLINEIGAINHPLHNLKVLTSYIRHNTVLLKPIEIVYSGKTVICDSKFDDYIHVLETITMGREHTKPIAVSYEATGYANKIVKGKATDRK